MFAERGQLQPRRPPDAPGRRGLVKTVDQQMLTLRHRLRSTWLATRTARLNILQGRLREFGVVIPTGAPRVVPVIRDLTDEPRVPVALRLLLATAADEIDTLQAMMHRVDQQLTALARQLAILRVIMSYSTCSP